MNVFTFIIGYIVVLLSTVKALLSFHRILDSIVLSMSACHQGNRSSIPCRSDLFFSMSSLAVIVMINVVALSIFLELLAFD